MQNRIVDMAVLLLLLLICASCAGFAADREKRVTFVVSPNPALMDDRVSIVVMGLTPSQGITIRARSKDQRERWWRSSAVFLVRQDGTIDSSAQAPISGSYAGVDAMGLFWSMEPDTSGRPVPEVFQVVDWFKPIVAEIEAV